PADRAVDPQPRGRLLHAALIAPHDIGVAGAVRRKPVPIHDQLEPPAAPAELAIGDGVKPRAFLHGDRGADAFLLDAPQVGILVRAEMRVGGLRAELALARKLQSRRPQQAAHVVGPEGRKGSMRPNFASSCERIYGTPCRLPPRAGSVASRGRGGRFMPNY